jgi:hypothetical protein
VLKQKGSLGIIVNGLPLQGCRIGIDAAGVTVCTFEEDTVKYETFLDARAVAAKLDEAGILPGYAFDIVYVESSCEGCLAKRIDTLASRLDTLTSCIADLITRDPPPQPPQEEAKTAPTEPVQQPLPLAAETYRVAVNPNLDIKTFLKQLQALPEVPKLKAKRLLDTCIALDITTGRELCAKSPQELRAAAKKLGKSVLDLKAIYLWERCLVAAGLRFALHAQPRRSFRRFLASDIVEAWSLDTFRDKVLELPFLDNKAKRERRRLYMALGTRFKTVGDLAATPRPLVLGPGVSFDSPPVIEADLAEFGLCLGGR